MTFIYLLFGLLYLLISVAFFAFGFNLYYLAWVSHRGRGRKLEGLGVERPFITIQLPIYNELYVAERLIRRVAELEYPSDKLEIQVLDDSTDETRLLVAQTVASVAEQGVNIRHIHRANREGFKAGALQNGLMQAEGELIAIFDADFLPERDFLLKTVPQFAAEDVAFVQTRWAHLNRNHSWFTHLQSIMIDAHFMIEQFGRSQAGYWFNFNGTAGVWRKAAMLDAGGWRADTLTEDLDLSYRAFLRGGRAVYLRDVAVPAELPVQFSGFRRQQHRWAKGSLMCAMKLIGEVWDTAVSPQKKLQALLHLFGYSIHLLLFATLLIYPIVIQIGAVYPRFQTLYGLSFVLATTALAPSLFFMLGQHYLGRSVWRQLPLIGLVSLVGSGMMFNTTRAAWQIVRGKREAFERTPKFGIGAAAKEEQQSWMTQRYQLQLDGIVYFELFFGLYSLLTGWFGMMQGNWGLALYASFFGVGLWLVAAMTIAEAVALRRHREARRRAVAREAAHWSAQ